MRGEAEIRKSAVLHIETRLELAGLFGKAVKVPMPDSVPLHFQVVAVPMHFFRPELQRLGMSVHRMDHIMGLLLLHEARRHQPALMRRALTGTKCVPS